MTYRNILIIDVKEFYDTSFNLVTLIIKQEYYYTYSDSDLRPLSLEIPRVK